MVSVYFRAIFFMTQKNYVTVSAVYALIFALGDGDNIEVILQTIMLAIQGFQRPRRVHFK